jgi:hypothetical protein
MDLKSYCFAAVLLSAGPGYGHAEQWFRLESPSTEADAGAMVEIDLDTLRTRSPGADAVIRVSHLDAKAHAAGFSYRSFIATAQIDCQRRALTLTSAAYFTEPAGMGMRVGADSAGRESGMPGALLESVPASARRALMRASCGAAQPY